MMDGLSTWIWKFQSIMTRVVAEREPGAKAVPEEGRAQGLEMNSNEEDFFYVLITVQCSQWSGAVEGTGDLEDGKKMILNGKQGLNVREKKIASTYESQDSIRQRVEGGLPALSDFRGTIFIGGNVNSAFLGSETRPEGKG